MKHASKSPDRSTGMIKIFSEPTIKNPNMPKKPTFAVKSSKFSILHNTQATLKIEDKSMKPINRCKEYLQKLKSSDSHTASTDSSSGSSVPQSSSSSTYFTEEAFSTPPKSDHLNKPQSLYLVKSSKAIVRKTPTEVFENTENSYFAGVRLFKIRKPQSTFNNCCVEYYLDGCTNTINSILEHTGKLWSGDSSCSLKAWTLPCISQDTYNAKSYEKGTIFTNNQLITKHKKAITSLEKYGETVISASKDGSIKLSKKLTKVVQTLKASPGINTIKLLQSPKLIVAGSEIEFKDLNTIKNFRDSICISPTYTIAAHSVNTFITGSNDGCIKLWDIRTSRFVSNFEAHYDRVSGLCMSSGYTFLSCSEDKRLKEWDLRSNTMVYVKKSEKKIKDIVIVGTFVVTAGESLSVWNTEGPESIDIHNGSVRNIFYSPEKELLFSAGFDGRIAALSFNPITE